MKYKTYGDRAVKLEKWPISSFGMSVHQSVSPSVTIISARDASASENNSIDRVLVVYCFSCLWNVDFGTKIVRKLLNLRSFQLTALDDLDALAIQLPYAGGRIVMDILLPNKM